MSKQRNDGNGPQIGSMIAHHRKQRKWTQLRLAQESGVPVTAIRRLEQMDQIQLTHLLRIISVLGTRLEIIPKVSQHTSSDISQPKSRTRRKETGIKAVEGNLRKQVESPVSSNHRKHEIRSLAMHRIIDQLLKRSPQTVIQHGLNNIVRWRNNGVDCEDLRTWETLLKQNPQKLSNILKGMDETSIRLRQSSPFPGLISQKERQRIFELHQ